MNKGHPLARKKTLTMDEYLASDHVSPTPITNALYSPIDSRLTQVGLRRRVMMSVPEYAQIPELLQETDLIFTTGAPYAQYVADTFGGGNLSLLPAPSEFEAMHVHILWHERVQNGQQHRWLRDLVRDVARKFDSDLHNADAKPSCEDLA
jgi:DNA-binding transcriptional LysR family regulator